MIIEPVETQPDDGPYIKRIDFDEEPAAFDQLKKNGIAYIQQMCGDTWTDHNAHDPGVTILDQLCFGLTELMYDSDYPVADYLVDSDGQMDWARLALHGPEQILTCRPTTVADIRELLLDELGDKAEIDNLWIEVMHDAPVLGLYRVVLQLSPGAADNVGHNRLATAIKTEVIECWLKVRNLGEDIGDITIVNNKPCRLSCTLETQDDYTPGLIVAQVYDLTASYLERPCVAAQDPQQTLVEDVFDGPLLQNAGYLAEPPTSDERLSMSALRTRLLNIAGVSQVLELDLSVNEQSLGQNGPKTPGLMLQLPPNQRQLDNEIKLSRLDAKASLDYEEINSTYQQLQSQRDPVLYNRRQLNELYAEPTGRYRPMAQYYPVRQQFPAVYGLNEKAQTALTDDKAKIARKAKINQMNAYLQLFDQLMANFKANLGFITTLFSTQLDGKPNEPSEEIESENGVQSYQFADFNNDRLGQISAAALQAHFDPAYSRKNRALDHLLALYGETFDQQIQRRFPVNSCPEVQQWQLLVNKTHYLKNIVFMTKDRGGGVNYAVDFELQSQYFGFAQKLAVHLDMCAGFESAQDRQNQRENLHVVEHVLLRPMLENGLENGFQNEQQLGQEIEPKTGQETADRDFYNFQISIVLPAWTERCANPAFRHVTEQLITQLCPAHLQANVYWLDFDQMAIFEKQWRCWQTLRQLIPFQAVADEQLLCECEIEPEKPDNQASSVKQLLQQYWANEMEQGEGEEPAPK
jgi:hypothetical protein